MDYTDAAARERVEDLAGKTDKTILDNTSSEDYLLGVTKVGAGDLRTV